MKNYKHATINRILDIADEKPDMTFGEILYTITRKKISEVDINSPKDLMNITDKDFYINTEKAYKDEKGE